MDKDSAKGPKTSWQDTVHSLYEVSSAADPGTAKLTFRSRRSERMAARASIGPVNVAWTSQDRWGVKIISRVDGRLEGGLRKVEG